MAAKPILSTRKVREAAAKLLAKARPLSRADMNGIVYGVRCGHDGNPCRYPDCECERVPETPFPGLARGAYLRCAELVSGPGGESNPVVLEQTFRRWADDAGKDDD